MEYSHDIQWVLKPEISGFMILNDTVVSAIEMAYSQLTMKFPWWWETSPSPTSDNFRRDNVMKTHFASYVAYVLSTTRLTYPTRWFSSITPSIIRRNYKNNLENLLQLEWTGTKFQIKPRKDKFEMGILLGDYGWNNLLSNIV
jgi:hypothetical protein